jgi:hypothetical protein
MNNIKKISLIIFCLVICCFSFFITEKITATTPDNTQGWCVFWKPISIGGGTNHGEHTSYRNCKEKNSWTAFCPDILGQGERNDSNCEKGREPIVLNSEAQEILNSNYRGELIELMNSKNPGDPVALLQTEKYRRYILLIRIKYICGYYTTPFADPDPEKTYYGEYYFGRISGKWELLSEANKMFSYMMRLEEQCTSIPYNCMIVSAYRPDDKESSAHKQGLAIDFSCGEKFPSGAGSCSTKANELLNRIKSVNKSFNIIRECTSGDSGTEENRCIGKDTREQIIHIDLKLRGAGEKCLYMNCDFNKCYPPVNDPAANN